MLLAGAGRTDDGGDRAGRGPEGHIAQHGTFGFVGETHVLKGNLAAQAAEFLGVGLVLHVRLDVQYVEHAAQPHGEVLSRHPVAQKLADVAARLVELIAGPGETG